MKQFVGAFSAGVVLLVASSPVFAGPIVTITNSTLEVRASLGFGSLASDLDTVTAFNTGTRIIESGSLGGPTTASHSQAEITYTSSSSNAELDFNFTQTLHGDYASSRFTGNIEFTANVDVAYSLSGLFDIAVDPDIDTPEVETLMFLTDLNDYSGLFDDWNYLSGFSGAHFGLGDPFDSHPSPLSGSLTGNLIAGHSYSLWFDYRRSDTSQPSPVASVGNVNMALSAVPEPSAILLLGMGLAGFRLSRKRARQLREAR